MKNYNWNWSTKTCVHFSCDFSCDYTKLVSDNWWLKPNQVNLMYYWPNNSIWRHCEHKHLEIKQFDTLHNVWQVVQNVYFAKSQEKPHKKSIFFGLSVPNLRKQNPARIRIRITQKSSCIVNQRFWNNHLLAGTGYRQ